MPLSVVFGDSFKGKRDGVIADGFTAISAYRLGLLSIQGPTKLEKGPSCLSAQLEQQSQGWGAKKSITTCKHQLRRAESQLSATLRGVAEWRVPYGCVGGSSRLNGCADGAGRDRGETIPNGFAPSAPPSVAAAAAQCQIKTRTKKGTVDPVREQLSIDMISPAALLHSVAPSHHVVSASAMELSEVAKDDEIINDPI
uniref:Uncharacterized protein n=1 Tax=Setaria digitata TaxID=48799 RepID=A0A915PY61_9BILA